MFPQGQHTEAVFQKWPRLHLVQTAELGSVRVRWYGFLRHEGVTENSHVLGLCGRAGVPEESPQERKSSPAAVKTSAFWRGHYQGRVIKNRVAARCTLLRRQRQVYVNSRPVWSTNLVPEQLELLHGEILS